MAFGFEAFLVATFLLIFLVFPAWALAAFGALVDFLAAFLAPLAGDLAGDEVATGAEVEATGVEATGAEVVAVLVVFDLVEALVLVTLAVFGLLFEAVLLDTDLF